MAHPSPSNLRFCSVLEQNVKVYSSSEPSQESCESGEDVLSCGEYIEDLTSTHAVRTPTTFVTHLRGWRCNMRFKEADTFEQACFMIKNELRRELELQPGHRHLERHPDLTPHIRCMTVSWLAEVAIELDLQQETLFMAVVFFNRYLGLSQGVFRSMVQLVAVACIALAVKQEEVDGADNFSPEVWTGLTDNTFQAQDLVRMEWLVTISLDWRTSAPTVYSFLHLLSYALSSTRHLSDLTVCVASYLAELSLLDYELSSYPYSHTACAALLLADIIARPAAASMDHDGGGTAAAQAFAATLQDVVPGLDMSLVCGCMSRLEALVCASSGASNELQLLLAPIREKYAQPRWSQAAAAVAAFFLNGTVMSGSLDDAEVEHSM